MTPQVHEGHGNRIGAFATGLLLFAVTCAALVYLGRPSYSAPANEEPSAVADGHGLFVRNPSKAESSRASRSEEDLLVLDEWDPNAVTRGRPQPGKKPSPPAKGKK